MSIYVTISSYCDPLLPQTLKDAYQKAKYPDQLFFGVVDQTPIGYPSKLPRVVPKDQMQYLHIDSRMARGPCWARAMGMSMMGRQDYFLQLDSHMLFDQDWDETLLQRAAMCEQFNEKFVISCYPPRWDYKDGKPVKTTGPDVVFANVISPGGKFDAEGNPWLPIMPRRLSGLALTEGFALGAGFIFAPGRIVNEIPYDPFLYFLGEEQSLAVRLFTSGWDIFHVVGVPIYHLYALPGGAEAPVKRPKHWEEQQDKGRALRWWRYDKRSKRRLKILFSKDASDLGVYGLGSERTLGDFAEFSGIDYLRRRLDRKAFGEAWHEQGYATSLSDENRKKIAEALKGQPRRAPRRALPPAK